VGSIQLSPEGSSKAWLGTPGAGSATRMVFFSMGQGGVGAKQSRAPLTVTRDYALEHRPPYGPSYKYSTCPYLHPLLFSMSQTHIAFIGFKILGSSSITELAATMKENTIILHGYLVRSGCPPPSRLSMVSARNFQCKGYSFECHARATKFDLGPSG